MKITALAVLFVAVVFATVWDESSSCGGGGGSRSSSSRRRSSGSGSSSQRPRSGWPSFFQLRSNYPGYYSITFDGLVDQEGLQPAFELKGLEAKNTCAMRVSRALNHAGRRMIVPSPCRQYLWKDVTDWYGRAYFIRVATMRCYLENEYGSADIDGSSESSYWGHQGIIVFQNCRFRTASGHVDLWDGYNCVGQCSGYFNACSNIRLFKF